MVVKIVMTPMHQKQWSKEVKRLSEYTKLKASYISEVLNKARRNPLSKSDLNA